MVAFYLDTIDVPMLDSPGSGPSDAPGLLKIEPTGDRWRVQVDEPSS
jgi:hypothetical protein